MIFSEGQLTLSRYVSCASMAMQALVSFRIAETLPPALRLPFRWSVNANPLSFLTLFRRGRTMVRLTRTFSLATHFLIQI